MKTWNAADAKRNFAKVLNGAGSMPQLLLLRGKPAGVVVSYDSFTKIQGITGEKSISQWLVELRKINEQEGDMEIPPRKDRPDQFGEIRE